MYSKSAHKPQHNAICAAKKEQQNVTQKTFENNSDIQKKKITRTYKGRLIDSDQHWHNFFFLKVTLA